MGENLEITAVSKYKDRDGNERSQFTRIGIAIPLQNGGYRLLFNAYPVPTMGDKGIETMALALPPKPKQDQQQSRGGGYAAPAGDRDEIPFLPCR